MSCLELAALASAPFWARRYTTAVLHAWQLWPDTIQTAQHLVSELVTNAISASCVPSGPLTYSGLSAVERISLTLRLLPGRVVIEVFDNNPNPPVLADADAESESGRGLMIVEMLSKEWGYQYPPAGGKIVYCVIEATPIPDPMRPGQADAGDLKFA
jgi:anti-sigma regulatory factor (Ser/Thr protein kinase)